MHCILELECSEVMQRIAILGLYLTVDSKYSINILFCKEMSTGNLLKIVLIRKFQISVI